MKLSQEEFMDFLLVQLIPICPFHPSPNNNRKRFLVFIDAQKVFLSLVDEVERSARLAELTQRFSFMRQKGFVRIFNAIDLDDN